MLNKKNVCIPNRLESKEWRANNMNHPTFVKCVREDYYYEKYDGSHGPDS